MKKIIALIIAALFIAAGLLPMNISYAGDRTQLTTVELNSGAGRDGNFTAVSQQFTTADSSLRQLHMTGLKTGNEAAMIACLEKYYSDSSNAVPLKVIDDAFCDAEKWNNDEEERGYDSGHCWLASIANNLWLSGWTQHLDSGAQEFKSEDELFWLFNDNFDDAGGPVDRGVDWFFMGEYSAPGPKKSASLKKPGTYQGCRKSLVSSLFQKNYDLRNDASYITNLLKLGTKEAVFEGSLGSLSDDEYTDSTHAVTIAGVITDPAAEKLSDQYKAIILIDSDNDCKPTAEELAKVEAAADEDKLSVMQEVKAARPNSYTVYPLTYHIDKNGTAGWLINGYAEPNEYGSMDEEALIYINELLVPSEDLISENTESEGTMDLKNDPDLTLDELFMTEDENGFRDPYSFAAKEGKETEFTYGDPIRLNYYVTDRSYKELTEYEDGKALTLTWKVTRDSDGAVVAEGAHNAELPIRPGYIGGTENNDIVTVNDNNGSIESWPTGAYTLTAELNVNRNIQESYYKNNVPQELHFSVVPNKEMAQASVKAAEAAVKEAKEAVDNFDAGNYDTAEEAQKALSDAQEKLIAVQDALIAAKTVLSKAEQREYNKTIKNLEEQVSDLQDQLDDALTVDISNYAVTVEKSSYEYTGTAIEPAVTVSGLEADDYYVDYEDNTNIGTAKIIITGTGKYTGTIEKTFKITKTAAPAPVNTVKAANTLKVSVTKAVKIKAKALKKKARKFSFSKAAKVSGAKGSVSYSLVSVKKSKFKKYFKINSKTGKIKVKKGLKKGRYKVKVKVTAAGNARYEAASKTVTLTVKVK